MHPIKVNPTYVGMDRMWQSLCIPCPGKPHVCGDGPDFSVEIGLCALVNPTYVGMDRYGRQSALLFYSKPHVCGDGPLYAGTLMGIWQ